MLQETNQVAICYMSAGKNEQSSSQRESNKANPQGCFEETSLILVCVSL
jgi:hypothetical protein